MDRWQVYQHSFQTVTNTSTAQRWKSWLERFDNLLVAIGITDNIRKRALLLHVAGERVYEIFLGLVVAAVAEDADPAVSSEYINAKTALNEYFNSKRNVEFEVYTFRLARQRADETTDSYHARLRTLAKYCEFVNLDSEIKSHIIQTCTSSRLRRRALTEPEMTLTNLLIIARAMESTERQTKVIESGNTQAVAAVRPHDNKQQRPWQRVNIVSSKRNTSSKQTCRNCCKIYPHAGGRESCPTFGKNCRACSNSNHFTICGRSKQQQQEKPSQNQTTTTYRPRQKNVRGVSTKQRTKHHPTILMIKRLLSATK